MQAAPLIDPAIRSKTPLFYRDRSRISSSAEAGRQHPRNGRHSKSSLKSRNRPKQTQQACDDFGTRGVLSSDCENVGCWWPLRSFRWSWANHAQQRWVRWPLFCLAVLISYCAKPLVQLAFTIVAIWCATCLLLVVDALGNGVSATARSFGEFQLSF
jgi:hypothetical protein